MTEGDAVSRRVRRRARVRFRRMTHSTGSEVTSVRLRIGRMTRVTARVRIQTCRDRQRGAAPQRRTVTGDAAVLWPGITRHVLRVIETDVEALFETIGEASARRVVAIHVLVANRAHRNTCRRELRQMTTGTVLMTREIRPRGIVGSMMTAGTGERSVL